MFDLIAQQVTQAAGEGSSELIGTLVLFVVGSIAAFFVIRWMLSVGKASKYKPDEISSQLAQPIQKDADDFAIAEILEIRTRLASSTLIQFLPYPLLFFFIILISKEFLGYFALSIYNAVTTGVEGAQTQIGNDPEMLVVAYLSNIFFSLVIGFVGFVAVNKLTGFPAFRAFFMGREHKLRDILVTIGILALSVLWIYFVVSYIWNMLLSGFGYELEEQIQIQFLRQKGTTWLWIATTLAVVVGAPFIEEILFRGFLYQFFRKRMSVMFAATSQGLIFAIMHMSLSALLPLWLLGVILALIVEKYKSLLPAMIAHAIFNAITIVTLLIKLN